MILLLVIIIVHYIESLGSTHGQKFCYFVLKMFTSGVGDWVLVASDYQQSCKLVRPYQSNLAAPHSKVEYVANCIEDF